MKTIVGLHNNTAILSIKNTELFTGAMMKAMDGYDIPSGEFGPGKTQEEYQAVVDEGGYCFLSEDSEFGIMLSRDGELWSGFKKKGSKHKRVINKLLEIGHHFGAKSFYCFGDRLRELYNEAGWKESYRAGDKTFFVNPLR